MVAIGLQETSPGQEVPTGLFKLALETIAICYANLGFI